MSTYCLINANTHRVKEGTRVLEEIARFILRDETLFKRTRKLRHSLYACTPIVSALPDLGGPSLKEDNVRSQLIAIVQANSSRIQEALRVLEEISQDSMDKQKLKSLRYQAYLLQQEFYKKTILFTKRDQLKGLYLIVDTDIIHLPIKTIVKTINQSAVNLIQLRRKRSTKRAYVKEAMILREWLHPDKLLIINDHIDIALDVADGIHLGQQDYPLERVRKLLPDDFLFGVTCHHVEEAKRAEHAGASYLSVGCLFPTQSKKDPIYTSLAELKKIQQNVHIPICAIGGINPQNWSSVLSCRVDMVAMISAIWHESNPDLAIKAIQEQLKSPILN